MTEKQLRIELDYTYTYDQFTVFFYGDRVFVGRKDYPIGQCCVDVMNLDESILDEIDQRVRLFIPAARKLPTGKTDSAAVLAQERLNAVWELIFALPVYRDLKMDEACCFHTFQRLMADKEKWAQVQDPTSEGYTIYRGMISGLDCFVDGLHKLRKQISVMTEKYLEPLERRNSGTYAEAYVLTSIQTCSTLTPGFGTRSLNRVSPWRSTLYPCCIKRKRAKSSWRRSRRSTAWQIFCGQSSIGAWPWATRRGSATTADSTSC
jgi:hypothetical protein